MQIRLNDPPKYNELYIQFYLTIGNSDLSEKMTEKDLTLICANFEEFQAELHNAHSGIQTIQETF